MTDEAPRGGRVNRNPDPYPDDLEATVTTNAINQGRRPTLSDQLDRLDRLLDGLADALADAVADAAREGVRVATREHLAEAAARTRRRGRHRRTAE